MPAVLNRYQRQIEEIRRGTQELSRGVKALKLVRENQHLLDEFGDAAFDVAAEMIDGGTAVLDMPDADAERILRFMADEPSFTQLHGAAAFEKAAEKLKIRFHRTPIAAFQDDDAEPAPQGGPIFGRPFDADTSGEQFDAMPGFGADANAAKVLKYMNSHPELCAKYGSRTHIEVAKLLGVSMG